ncbi:glycine-rich domain-containing protein [Planobispora rosea]|uniref:glycine-rich domain-containing protein n=1 Tax=Planobispora rosea TaxID=35762 RepID=UPI00083A7FC9|nr:hypothetical protein [Planobispora rosea]
MTVTTHTTADPRTLITPELHARLTARIRTEHPEHGERSDAIVDQALAFLAACAANPRAGLGPSDLVDIGWHTFLMYTREYAEFCDRVAGRFIHHQPDDNPVESAGASGLAVTIAAIQEAGYDVDPSLWPMAADCSNQKCSQCHQGCVDSPGK